MFLCLVLVACLGVVIVWFRGKCHELRILSDESKYFIGGFIPELFTVAKPITSSPKPPKPPSFPPLSP